MHWYPKFLNMFSHSLVFFYNFHYCFILNNLLLIVYSFQIKDKYKKSVKIERCIFGLKFHFFYCINYHIKIGANMPKNTSLLNLEMYLFFGILFFYGAKLFFIIFASENDKKKLRSERNILKHAFRA